ncbi:hypothetical protein AJ80_02016 [Polytolypa hystricis UAMH7299]|uniref:Uncharacterized protein n=1 Tax=Polytolypa hystricis (strain UAMH7299) TaxID=1447883 RepID=A0A2B7YIP8_POLH7|nr:hypothetical protein AJ80_02016 [Polytolypa hystricis UAMH7299]
MKRWVQESAWVITFIWIVSLGILLAIASTAFLFIVFLRARRGSQEAGSSECSCYHLCGRSCRHYRQQSPSHRSRRRTSIPRDSVVRPDDHLEPTDDLPLREPQPVYQPQPRDPTREGRQVVVGWSPVESSDRPAKPIPYTETRHGQENDQARPFTDENTALVSDEYPLSGGTVRHKTEVHHFNDKPPTSDRPARDQIPLVVTLEPPSINNQPPESHLKQQEAPQSRQPDL